MKQSTAERILSKIHNLGLAVMQRNGYVSLDLVVYKAVLSVQTDVYGIDAGEESIQPTGEFQALVEGDAFSPTDNRQAGTLQEGWLYTTSGLINNGDVVAMKRNDFRNRKYKVTDLQSIGTTMTIFKKFHLSSIGD